jgi:hypothetical protein
VRKPGSMEVIDVKKEEKKKMAGCAFVWRPDGNEPLHIAPIRADEDGRPARVMVKAPPGPSGKTVSRSRPRKGPSPLIEDWNLGVERFQLTLSAALIDARTGIRRTGTRL